MMLMKRRDFLKAGAAAGAMASLYGCAGGGKASGHVVVVGGGYGGATVAKYLRMWSEGGVQVTLIERNPTFISCPISNLVIGGTKTMEDITVSYDGLKNKWGVRVIIQDDVVAVDAAKRSISLAKGGDMSYDRLVLSPGVDFMWDQIPGLNNAAAQGQDSARLEGRPADRRPAQATGRHEGRRRLRHLHPQGTLPLPARTLRARLPGRQLLQAEQAEIQGHHPRRQRGCGVQERAVRTKAWTDLYKDIIEYRPTAK
jgi:sulfide dehydrogenase [flavocytochrome c] flavoprotein subunit